MTRANDFLRLAGTRAVSSELKRRSVLGALVTGAGGGLDAVLRLGSTLILARLLIPEDFGLVAMVTVVARIAERFSTLGLSAATVQAPEITHSQCSNLFWINAAAGLVFAGILLALSPVIATFYEDARLQSISAAISLNFVWTGLSVQHDALLRRQMKMTQIAGNRLAATFFGVCLAVALALSGFGYWALVCKELAQCFFTGVGAWLLCPWIPGLPSRSAGMDRLVKFGKDMTLTQLLLSLSANLDSLLIGKFGGAVELGWYRQAHNLIMTPVERLNAPIHTVSQPGLSTLQFDAARYRKFYQHILFVVSLGTIPLGIFSVIYAPEIVLVALGEKWLGAVPFLRIFGFAAAIQPAMGTSGLVLITRGKSARFLFVNLVYSTALLVLMIVGSWWGALGIASARVTIIFLVFPWALWYCLSGSPVSMGDFLRIIAKPAGASVMMALALLVLRNSAHIENAALSLAVGSATAIAVYPLALNLMPGGRDQLRLLANEVVAALRRRSSIAVEHSEDSTSH